MYNHQEYTANYPDSFKLNLRILSDALSDRFSDIRIKAESDLQCLCSLLQIYLSDPGQPGNKSYQIL